PSTSAALRRSTSSTPETARIRFAPRPAARAPRRRSGARTRRRDVRGTSGSARRDSWPKRTRRRCRSLSPWCLLFHATTSTPAPRARDLDRDMPRGAETVEPGPRSAEAGGAESEARQAESAVANDVEIRPADSAGRDLHEDLAGARNRIRDVFEDEGPRLDRSRSVEPEGAHPGRIASGFTRAIRT